MLSVSVIAAGDDLLAVMSTKQEGAFAGTGIDAVSGVRRAGMTPVTGCVPLASQSIE